MTFLTDTNKKAELKSNPTPIPEPTYRPVAPNPPNDPNPSADHKAVSSVPDDCQSEPRSKVKKVPTSASKQMVTCLGRVSKPPKSSNLYSDVHRLGTE